MSKTTYPVDWYKQIEPRKYTVGGINYVDGFSEKYDQHETGRRNIIISHDLDLTYCADDFSELLVNPDHDGINITLGNTTPGHNLVINSDYGTVYVNSRPVKNLTGLTYLGDGSWGIEFGGIRKPLPKNKLIRRLKAYISRAYDNLIDTVFERAAHFGMVENNPLYKRSIWRLIDDSGPKGEILSINFNKSA